MGLQHDIARSHLETLIEQITGIEKAEPDADGDYRLPTERASFFARVMGESQPVFQLYSVVASGLEHTPDLFEALNELNTQLVFARAMVVDGQVMIESEVLAMSADQSVFRNLCRRIATASDNFGPTLVDRFGGESDFENSKSHDYETPQVDHPGYL